MRKRRTKLFIVDAGFQSVRWAGRLFNEVTVIYGGPLKGGNIDKIDAESVVLFEGGTDISPMIYKQKPSRYTQSANKVRDAKETFLFHRAMAKGAGCIGVCRGAQLITALNGGSLFQHVTGHSVDHLMETNTGQKIETTSSHHQMINLSGIPEGQFKLLAWASEPLSRCYLDQNEEQTEVPELEPEVVWFPNISSLCIQGHPEWAHPESAYGKYCQQLVKDLVI